jgi:hypothetical protein
VAVQPIPHCFDWEELIGLLPEELDPPLGRRPCWPLVRAAFRRGLGVSLPAHDTVGPSPAEAEDACLGEAASGRWEEVPLGRARPWDVMLDAAEDGLAGHCGVVVEPGLLLHAMRGSASCTTPYDRRTGAPFSLPRVFRLRAPEASPAARPLGRGGPRPGRADLAAAAVRGPDGDPAGAGGAVDPGDGPHGVPRRG